MEYILIMFFKKKIQLDVQEIAKMEKELISGKMEKDIPDNGRMEKDMEKALINGHLAILM